MCYKIKFFLLILLVQNVLRNVISHPSDISSFFNLSVNIFFASDNFLTLKQYPFFSLRLNIAAKRIPEISFLIRDDGRLAFFQYRR